MSRLQPDLSRAEYTTGETPTCGDLHQIIPRVRGDFSLEFHAIEYIHFNDKTWWGKMIGLALVEFEDLLPQA